MNAVTLPNVYTIPLGVPFAKTLAQSLWDEYRDDLIALSDVEIYLPNRRSCRSLADAFLEVSQGRATLLPHMTPLGDIDDDDLLENDPFILDEDPHLKLAIHPLERQTILTRLLLKREDLQLRPADAFLMAGDLAALIDRAHTESVDLNNIATLVTGDLAKHWQVTSEFLSIITDIWPSILNEMDRVDPAERRNIILAKKAESLRRNRPTHRIIAAGSTGSIAATATLLEIIARLPNGCLVLPGFDPEIDTATWDSIDVQHPYHYQKRLLDNLLIEPKQVRYWQDATADAQASAKKQIALGALQPEASFNLADIRADSDTLRNLTLIAADHTAHEARIIATILRKILDDGTDKTAMVVTPDRDLARRIQLEMRRWDVAIDDSGGESLRHKPIAVFLGLIADLATSATPATHILSLLRHPLCLLQQTPHHHDEKILLLEKDFRASPLPSAGLAQFLELHPEHEILKILLEETAPLATGETLSLVDWIRRHVGIAERLAGDGTVAGSEFLWTGDDGEAVARVLQDFLSLENDHSLVMTAEDYAEFFKTVLHGIILRPKQRLHPRLHILSPIEARLLHADTIILAGLNEHVWPARIGQDHWLSRPMRQELGFSESEARIGQSALDFIYLFCMPDVILTWSSQREDGQALPSRWIQQIFAVMEKHGVHPHDKDGEFFHWAKKTDIPSAIVPHQEPSPRPPLSARPMRLSVTQIDTWKKDPYAIYADKILNLRPVEALDRPLDVRDWGNAAHNVLERFIGDGAYASGQAADIFDRMSDDILAAQPLNPSQRMKWTMHLRNLRDWAIEDARNSERKPHVEAKKDITVPIDETQLFTLHGRADRVDYAKQGMMVTDYKTGTTPRLSEIRAGDAVQLPLLGYLFSQDGTVDRLRYIKVEGKQHKAVTEHVFDQADELIEVGKNVLSELLDAFYVRQVPYQARALALGQFDRYRHLKRSAEWSVVIEETDEEVAA